MLVAAGASLIIQDNNGRTARLLALEAEDRDLSAYLESEYLRKCDFSYFGQCNDCIVFFL